MKPLCSMQDSDISVQPWKSSSECHASSLADCHFCCRTLPPGSESFEGGRESHAGSIYEAANSNSSSRSIIQGRKGKWLHILAKQQLLGVCHVAAMLALRFPLQQRARQQLHKPTSMLPKQAVAVTCCHEILQSTLSSTCLPRFKVTHLTFMRMRM